MAADDSKYGRIVAERKEFHEDEPVFVLRGQDLLAPLAIEAYANLARASGRNEVAEQCDNVAVAMLIWQSTEGVDLVKMPD